uniref:Uncharacterized protein n=1 Tax=Oryza sativa subsp. japonica TaxID=39947 RepID=Q6ET31_ORYSJ|nr:hypothetical protein [Oryza sativa Japonica Group]
MPFIQTARMLGVVSAEIPPHRRAQWLPHHAARGCHQPFHFIRPSPLSFLLSAFSGAFYLSSMIAMATCSSCYEDASDYDICIACVSSPLILVSTMM